MITPYKGMNVVERDDLAVVAGLIARHELDIREPVRVVGTIVRVVPAPEGSGLPPQLLVYWEGADFVPDLTTWEMPMWLDQVYEYGCDGFPIFTVETDGYGHLVARDPEGTEMASVEIDRDWEDRDQAFFAAVTRLVAGWWRKRDYQA